MHLEYNVKAKDFSTAGYVSSQIKKTLKQLGVNPCIIKRVVVALYEAEVNIVAHADGGVITADIDQSGIKLVLADQGPGIPDIELAMKKGYSTASDEVRQMGFGAGMGLPNVKDNVDDLQIDSVVGEGTTLKFYIKF